MNRLTVIMYHYIRDLGNSRYPNINALLPHEFKNQINYFEYYYNFVTMQDCINYLYKGSKLPKNPILLTFDDAYIDHYLTVFPLLDEKGIQGCFFPPAKAIMENKVLDVNKIHFILASTSNVESLINDIYKCLDKYRNKYHLKNNDYYFAKLAKSGRYDSEAVVFIKQLLQIELGSELRSLIINDLFEKYVGIEEKIFSKELYMNIEQIKCLSRKGMFIGSHGYNHDWLNTFSPQDQRDEVELCLNFLEEINVSLDNWAMCYPYGGYNKSLINILLDKNCKIAFTTNVGIANLSKSNSLELERLNTNDFPKNETKEKNIWVKKA